MLQPTEPPKARARAKNDLLIQLYHGFKINLQPNRQAFTELWWKVGYLMRT